VTGAAPLLNHPRYEAREELGRGAQGVVLRVVDREAPERALAAKLWLSDVFDEQTLLGEFALLSRLRIPGLVRAHDLGRDIATGAPFLVEDFVGGPEASAWCAEVEPERAARLVSVLADVLGSLALLHDAGFVHGDLKPAHVRMTAPAGPRSRSVLLDLGAAIGRARDRSAPSAFSRAWASPEILAGAAASPASDLHGVGALAWAFCTGRAPDPAVRAPLRRLAAWVPPSVADLVEDLLAPHPRDRPSDAREALGRLGALDGTPLGLPPAPIGRERELAALLDPPRSGVRYLVGPSGAGKSHLARELATRALVAGRGARIVSFSAGTVAIASRLAAYFRGSDEAWPFIGTAAPVLLVLDDLDLAPAEIRAALDAYRCRPRPIGSPVEILATARAAPDGAEALPLGPLDLESFGELCRALGLHAPERIRETAAESGGSPGWLVASLGCVALTPSTAMERIRTASKEAVDLLCAVATVGGTASDALCRRVVGSDSARPLAELCAASLVTRRRGPSGVVHALTAPALARDLAAALGTFERVDRVADALLAEADAPATSLLAVAGAEHPPARRDELLHRAAARARSDGLRAEEIEALFALAGDRRHRTTELLCRLERLTRDTGTAASHPQVLAWLDEAAASDPQARPLALRRQAERRAREGDVSAARRLAEEAREAAHELSDPTGEALALATLGAVALFRADWTEADQALTDARARLAGQDVADAEEVARLEHNAGVVALYRGRARDAALAFERSLATKRRLGDRAGMRSCLLNLGLALAKDGRLDEADRALAEAILLARALGQVGGRGWCLAARADVAVRRHDALAAERWIAEAETIQDTLPAAVRADLGILRAQVALLEGDGARALAELRRIGSDVRQTDSLIDARALCAEASAYLAILPADRRRAARLAVRAARKATAATLPEALAQALEVLHAARRRAIGPRASTPAAEYPRTMEPRPPEDDEAWRWIADVARGLAPGDAARGLARLVARRARAERAFVARVDPSGRVTEAWGADIDGLPVGDARERLEAGLGLGGPMRSGRAIPGKDGPVYQRDIETVGGRGSRLAVTAPDPGGAPGALALVVAEHRFSPAHFDDIEAAQATRWATLASLTLRLVAAAESVSASSGDAASESTGDPPLGPRNNGHTTALPIAARRAFPGIVGQSAPLQRALARLDAATGSDLPVLLVGETGVGKEVFARALHDLGPRKAKAFVAVNCAAIPDALFEAELFGHARGSFTGADRARAGLVARAEGGTLLLDEIGELPLLRQAALLRALESRRYRAVGSDDERPFDVRIVAATNRDLERAVVERTFRQDLLFRLNAVEIRIPPLRERSEDVAELVRSFLDKAGSTAVVSPRAMATLRAYAWPGNVRELEHHVQRLASLKVGRIDVEHLSRPVRSQAARTVAEEPPVEPDAREEIRLALEKTGGNISRAAQVLGLTRHGLKKRMVRLGMRPLRLADEDGE